MATGSRSANRPGPGPVPKLLRQLARRARTTSSAPRRAAGPVDATLFNPGSCVAYPPDAMAGYFVTPSQMPGAWIEPLFITDPFEATIAATAIGQNAIASGIELAVQQYLSPPVTAAPGQH
jgi:hypothetical protein